MKGNCLRGLISLIIGLSPCEVLASRAIEPNRSQQQGIGRDQPQVDLSDPRVRERLRAAGIDPSDLEELMGSGVPVDPESLLPQTPAASEFPPVTQPPSMRTIDRDSSSVEAMADSVVSTPRYFGYEIFTLEPTTFEPLAFGPVSPDYLLGPGDEIMVSVWGAQELNARAMINREGYLLLPDLGRVVANGYTLQSFKEHLEKQLSRIYSGIRSDGQGSTFVEVSLGKLRSIQVFVLGDVVQPGGYTLSSTSTVMNALYFAGGPTLKGSLRNVRVLRNNQIVREADLYEYIALGKRSQDVRLENGDVVFVPPVAKRVTLEGEIHHPGLYELRQGEKVDDLFKLSGGLTSISDRSRLQIERIIPFQERSPLSQEDRKIMDFSMGMNGEIVGAQGQLQDGDIIRVFPIRDILKNTVKLLGTAVYKPGTYQHHDGMNIKELIELAGGLLGDAYTPWAHLIRTRDDKTRELVSFNLESALRGDPSNNLRLQQLDEIQVFSIWDIRDPDQVTIQGLVRKPGVYDLLEGMTITDLILQAGGMRESAYRKRAEVSRINPEAVSEGKTSELVYVPMADSMNTNTKASRFTLRKNDMVFIREIPNWALQENVWVTGEVKFPGMYSLTSKLERMSSVIERAGGLETTAYLKAASFVRKKDNTWRMALDFEDALEKKRNRTSKYDLVLVAGDSIHIPREPSSVKVTGEVGFPSSVLWEDGKDMDYYIDQAGGLLESAHKDKITVVMANGRVQRSGFLSSPEPDAGARVVVPRKPEENDKQTLKSIAQIVSILSGAATTIYLINRSVN